MMPIQGLWIGSELSVMERLSIASFLRHGHDYHLYVYHEMDAPRGTVVKDAEEILPASMIFQYSDRKSYAAFSNFFRYKLLLEKGGWWVDTDVICLRPFDFPKAYVFATEAVRHQVMITAGIIKAPVASDIMRYAWRICQTKVPENLVWGEVGAQLMAAAVKTFALERYTVPPDVFSPLGYGDWKQVLDAPRPFEFKATTYAVHLWNDMWRRNACDKDRPYHPDCLYEHLKRRYLAPPD